ncbi:MAG: ATP-dependent DNA helicase, partial [Gammaproteobacteria bacterium]
QSAATAAWDSPFDYPVQALLYLPYLTAEPNSADYLPAVVETALAVIKASRGRAFLLCTSHRALVYCAGPLRQQLDYPVLVQGEAPRAALLEEFKRLGNAILVGTATFWEGIDVRGEALSCVIIDKLPFAPPDDPILRARIRRMEAEGFNPFRDYQVPVAALSLKQGAGRLIRDVTDRGVLVICDPRLEAKSYGRIIARALPAMRRTRSFAEVATFFAQ